jgi:hypothetical protein
MKLMLVERVGSVNYNMAATAAAAAAAAGAALVLCGFEGALQLSSFMKFLLGEGGGKVIYIFTRQQKESSCSYHSGEKEIDWCMSCMSLSASPPLLLLLLLKAVDQRAPARIMPISADMFQTVAAPPPLLPCWLFLHPPCCRHCHRCCCLAACTLSPAAAAAAAAAAAVRLSASPLPPMPQLPWSLTSPNAHPQP